MPQFKVLRPEVHFQTVIIDASSHDEAFRLVYDGHGTEVGEADYDSTLEPEQFPWYVESNVDNPSVPADLQFFGATPAE